MNAFYSEIASAILQIVCALIGLVMTAVVVPWLKGVAIPWMKEKRIYGLVSKFVYAAEKLAETGVIDKESKKDYVVELLKRKGYAVTDEVEAFIESAVKELDMSFESGIGEILDTFGEDDNDSEAKPENTEAAEEVDG